MAKAWRDWRADTPFTHSQFDDLDKGQCRADKHHWVEGEGEEFVCSRCGLSDIEGDW